MQSRDEIPVPPAKTTTWAVDSRAATKARAIASGSSATRVRVSTVWPAAVHASAITAPERSSTPAEAFALRDVETVTTANARETKTESWGERVDIPASYQAARTWALQATGPRAQVVSSAFNHSSRMTTAATWSTAALRCVPYTPAAPRRSIASTVVKRSSW